MFTYKGKDEKSKQMTIVRKNVGYVTVMKKENF